MQQFRVPSLRHSPVRSLLRTRFTSPPSIEILRERAIGHPHPITLSGTLTSECMGSSWPHAGGWSKSRADRCCELRLPARRVGCSSDDPSRNARSGNGSGSVGETPLAFGGENGENGFGGGSGKKPLPTQGDAVVEGPGESRTALKERDGEGEGLKSSDLDYLAELIAMQEEHPKDIGFFGTRNMGYMHQQLIEVLSYAMVLTGNHIYTSGATGTNAAVIRGALKADKADLLTVVLPQSLEMQPEESQVLLQDVKHVIAKPEADHLTLLEASRICNRDIVSRVKQVICFAFHDSRLLLETCRDASEARRVVALFYLD